MIVKIPCTTFSKKRLISEFKKEPIILGVDNPLFSILIKGSRKLPPSVVALEKELTDTIQVHLPDSIFIPSPAAFWLMGRNINKHFRNELNAHILRLTQEGYEAKSSIIQYLESKGIEIDEDINLESLLRDFTRYKSKQKTSFYINKNASKRTQILHLYSNEELDNIAEQYINNYKQYFRYTLYPNKLKNKFIKTLHVYIYRIIGNRNIDQLTTKFYGSKHSSRGSAYRAVESFSSALRTMPPIIIP
jgi:hypothetical protein